MVNLNEKTVSKASTKAQLLEILRDNAGKPQSGNVLAKAIGVSRVAVWKGVQSLVEAGYPVETQDSGYALDPGVPSDFLYPWEFGEQEAIFRHFESLGSTMDCAREYAGKQESKAVFIAEKQSAGKGRYGRSWSSNQGGLFCTIFDRPKITISDYCLPVMIYQIAIARVLGAVCGKPAWLRWPNDVYIGRQKIAGVMAELGGTGDSVSWLAVGFGVNVNNRVPSDKAVSCARITERLVSRREVLLRIFNEAEQLWKQVSSGMAYVQGNRLLAAKWNAIADCMGAKAAVVDSSLPDGTKDRVLARGIFAGIDPAGRCIIRSESGKGALYFNPGPISVVFYN